MARRRINRDFWHPPTKPLPDLRYLGRDAVPLIQRTARFWQRDGFSDNQIQRYRAPLKEFHDGMEVFRKCIKRNEDIQLLKDKLFGVVSDRLPGITDIDDPAGKRDLVHRRTVSCQVSDGWERSLPAWDKGEPAVKACVGGFRSVQYNSGISYVSYVRDCETDWPR